MATHDVHPTGRYPDDLDAVSAAIDAAAPGDSILLRATDAAGAPMFFHFGDDTSPQRGWINFTKDITIVGEPMPPSAFVFPDGRTTPPDLTPDRTLIYGGKRPFQCRPTNANAATTLAVRGLYFAYPTLAAVQVRKSAGLDVSDCIVCGVRSGETDLALRVATGIEATGLDAVRAGEQPDLTGDFRVSNNTVTRSDEPATYLRPDGGIILQLARMNADIHDNDIRQFGAAGIAIDACDGSSVDIRHNTIARCGYGDHDGLGFVPAAGIIVRHTNSPAPSTLTVTANTVVGGAVTGPAGTPLESKNGISVWGSSWVDVHANTVTGTLLSAGILVTAFVDAAGNRTVSTHNRITGNHLPSLPAGHEAVSVDSDCTDNLVQGNRVEADLQHPR